MPAPTYIGHERITESIWRMVSEGRLPQTLLFAGQRGVGKTTLARHLAAGINCAAGPGKPCGDCSPCQRILATDLSKREYRKILSDRRTLPAAKRSENPLVVGVHPDVLLFPPDGPMRMIGIDQARFIRNQARVRPSEGRRRIFVITEAERANSEAANALLKTLEEPASKLTIILTSVNPYLLPATIRSRSIPFYFGGLSPEEMETFLVLRKDIEGSRREQVSAWSMGSPGIALSIDVGDFLARRKAMISLIRAALSKGDFASLAGEMTAIARTQSEGIDRLAEMLSSLLRDLLRLRLGVKRGLTHRDIAPELARLASSSSFPWTVRAVEALDGLEKLQQTNIQKQIAMEAYALSLRK